jgi:hypothetical protein
MLVSVPSAETTMGAAPTSEVVVVVPVLGDVVPVAGNVVPEGAVVPVAGGVGATPPTAVAVAPTVVDWACAGAAHTAMDKSVAPAIQIDPARTRTSFVGLRG